MEQTARRYLDNTMLSTYRECPRKYYLRHVRGWRKDGTAMPLVFGLSWHAAMDVVWQQYQTTELSVLLENAAQAFDETWASQGMPLDAPLEVMERWGARTPMIAREMLVNYVDKRHHVLANARLVACEQPFAVPLPLDDGEDVWYAGRLDKVVDYNGALRVIEHKTTSEYKIDGGFKNAYVESWYMDSQVMGYLYGAGLYFNGLEDVWIDAALVHKKVHDAFKFIPVGHQYGMLEHWIEDTKEWVRRLKRDEANLAEGRRLLGGVFPKQQGSCVGKYGPCPYLDVCRTQHDPSAVSEAPAGYLVEHWSPFDVLELHKLLDK